MLIAYSQSFGMSAQSTSSPFSPFRHNGMTEIHLEQEMARDVELEERLEKTRLELEQSRAECSRLAQIRDDVEAEVRELTASLFQVTNRLVRMRRCSPSCFLAAFKTGFISVRDVVCVCVLVKRRRRGSEPTPDKIRAAPPSGLFFFIYIRLLP